ncbi:MAG: AarF/ABC1/UbiB kinase family protein [Pirellulales bacterium]|nr:AarF/ABC1/UbiB kinase family protein [Pirellulales bacterium]
MKLLSIPHLYRNVNRSVEILSVLSKYGLADWVSRLDLEFAKELFKDRAGEVLARQRPETRIRLALAELGPTFIKLGQVLSTRADLVGVALATELSHLQAEVAADPPESVRATIEAELGSSLESLFAEFEPQPLASASIGQVHRARLHTGERVAVKVQHRGIESKVRIDLEILAGLAQLAERIPEFRYYRPQATVAEFQRTLLRELDFTREERNMQQFAHNLSDDPTVHIPRTYPKLCSARVLTMEYIEGIKLSDTERLAAAGMDLQEVARRGAELYLNMIFMHGTYHADPHPGNIVLLPGNVIGLLDFGMVGRIDEPLLEEIEEMLLAVMQRDALQLTAIITRVGAVPPELDQAGLSIDVADFVAHYGSLSLDEFDLGGALNELTEMIRRYHIMLPARVALLLKVLVMLEGTARLLAPRFSLLEVMQPYQKRMLWRRMSPARQARKLRRMISEFQRLLALLPRGLTDILQQIQSGKFDVHLDHRGLEPSVNRLVFGMITSALFLGSTLLLAHEIGPLIPWPPAFSRLSVLGTLGCLVSLALGLRLLRAINKSGHLDRR